MTDASTQLSIQTAGSSPVSTFNLSQTGFSVGGASTGGGTGGGGLSLAAADARYIQQSAINTPNGVAGLSASKTLGEAQLPIPAVDLTVLFNNKLV